MRNETDVAYMCLIVFFLEVKASCFEAPFHIFQIEGFKDLEVRVEELHSVSMLELLGAARSHNSMADFCVSMHINRADTYNFPETWCIPK